MKKSGELVLVAIVTEFDDLEHHDEIGKIS